MTVNNIVASFFIADTILQKLALYNYPIDDKVTFYLQQSFFLTITALKIRQKNCPMDLAIVMYSFEL